MPSPRLFLTLPLAGALAGCIYAEPQPPGSTDASTGDDPSTTTDTTAEPTTAEPTPTSTGGTTGEDATTGGPTTRDMTTSGEDPVAGVALMSRLGGLWSGSATMTVLGEFPLMNMDMRDASPHVLFSRVDLDPFNSLRFAFSIETHQGKDVLIFRNGGQFMGFDRDTRTALVESDEAGGHWRFCAIDQGCDYVDAVFDLAADDALVLDVTVKGAPHLHWDAARKEERELPDPFPVDFTSQGTGDAGFPPLPSLRTTVTWKDPLAAPADVWAILTVTPCDLTLTCTHSRSLRVTAPAGATSAELEIVQLHPGAYKLNAILDNNQNMPTTLFPDSGDGLGTLNKAVTVAPEGETAASTPIFFYLP